MSETLFIIIISLYGINLYMLEKRISKLENKLVKNNLCGPRCTNNLHKEKH